MHLILIRSDKGGSDLSISIVNRDRTNDEQ